MTSRSSFEGALRLLFMSYQSARNRSAISMTTTKEKFYVVIYHETGPRRPLLPQRERNRTVSRASHDVYNSH